MNTYLSPRIPKRESNTVEFKTSFGSAVIESLCALANAQGGSVFVGVNDSGEPVGVDLAKDSILNWLNEIRTKTTPAIIPDPDLLSDNYVSSPRNKKIADFFKDLGLIEKYGSGIQRVLRQFQQEGLPSPLIEAIADGIRITVFGNPESKGEKSESKGEIIKAMQGNNQITVEELACLLSLSIGGIEKNIRQLKKAGILTRIGSNKGGHWKILK